MAEAKESRELAPEESSRVDSLNGRPFTRCVERMAFLVISAGHAFAKKGLKASDWTDLAGLGNRDKIYTDYGVQQRSLTRHRCAPCEYDRRMLAIFHKGTKR